MAVALRQKIRSHGPGQTVSDQQEHYCDEASSLFTCRGSLVVKISDRGWFVTSSSPVPLKICRVGKRCTLNLSRAQTSSRWCGVVVRRGPEKVSSSSLDHDSKLEVRRQKPSRS
ncbi:hypothetical protein TNCV_2658091 [Trichonephila clavipes]|nr:hypothetical protein TNCV_2658091 [Trichonephila clavipes]